MKPAPVQKLGVGTFQSVDDRGNVWTITRQSSGWQIFCPGQPMPTTSYRTLRLARQAVAAATITARPG